MNHDDENKQDDATSGQDPVEVVCASIQKTIESTGVVLDDLMAAVEVLYLREKLKRTQVALDLQEQLVAATRRLRDAQAAAKQEEA